MKSPIWLIEADVFGRSSEPVKDAIRTMGMSFEIVHSRPFLNGVVPIVAGQKLADDDCVVFWGSPPLMHHIQQNYHWRPGGWCRFANFDCREYYPRFTPFLLNSVGRMGTIDEQLRDVDELFREYGVAGKVFVRPNTLEKIFTGRTVTRDDFVWTLESARYSNCHIYVARPAPISVEWRVLFHGGQPIAASQYKRNDQLDVQTGCPTTISQFAERVVREVAWVPDELFVMDVCESNGKPYVLELNSFSCSGWYASDPAAIVRCAATLAASNWNRGTQKGV